MTRIVIADAGPLIALARIGHFELLNKLFGNVSVTSTVADEVLQGGDFPGGSVLSQAFAQVWLQRLNADGPDQLSQAKCLMNMYQIDPDESSSMVLAQEAHAQGDQAMLVMGDLRRRNAAQHAHLPMIGTTCVLLLAKQQGQVMHVRPLLLDLQKNGYFLSQRLIDSALQQAGE